MVERHGVNILMRNEPATASHRTSESGFSATELLASMAIMAIVATLGFYTFQQSSWRSKAGISKMVRQLELTRSRAIFEQNDFIVTFDVNVGTYTIHDDENNNGTFEPNIGETQTVYSLSSGGTGTKFGFPSGTRDIDGNLLSSAITIPGSPPKITFTPLGRATSGSIYVISEEDYRKGKPDAMRAVTVYGSTARLRRWRYDDSSGGPGPWRLD